MRLTIVGCSGSVPGPDSPSSCYLVEHDGFKVLLDLKKRGRAEAVEALEAIVARLKG